MSVATGAEAARGSLALRRALLVAGLLGGAGAAAIGLAIGERHAGLPPQAVARVNGKLILRDAWLRAVAAVASERRGELSEADKRRILDRLIDEELLVQRGVSLGLVDSDARLRDTMVSEVMLAASNAAAALPEEDALKAFYKDNAWYFAEAGRVRVRAWRVAADGSRSEFTPAVPDALLPLAKVQAYLGPALAQRAAALSPETVSEPIETPQGRVVLQVLEREAGAAPAYEKVRDEVRAEYRRRADEAAVRDLLRMLRADGRVDVSLELP